MIQFQEFISASHIFPAVFCSGILFFGLMLYIMMYYNSHDKLHMAMIVIGFSGFLFVLSESLIMIMGWELLPSIGMQFHRLEQIGATLLIFGIPYFLHYMLQMTTQWKKINQKIYRAMLIITGLFILVAFIFPDLFVSVKNHRHDWLLR